MKSYQCGIDAVALCRWCFVGLCREHLAQSLAERTGAIMHCQHQRPAAGK